MAKVQGFLGFLKQNAATGTPTGTYNTVTQIQTVSAVGSTRALIDVSAHGDMWADYLPGRQDGAEVALTVMWDPTVTTHVNMKTDYDATTTPVRYYELQHPSWTSAYRFASIVSVWDVEATDDGAMEAHITLKIVNPGVTTVTPS